MDNKIAIILGSENDRKYVEGSYKYFDYFQVQVETHVISAHRKPSEVADFAVNAHKNGYKILIGGAGMAAHLAGALKANSILPVIGVPLPGGVNDGLDALLSTVQMPKGVPVATMAVGKHGMINAAILSVEILALNSKILTKKLLEFKKAGSKV